MTPKCCHECYKDGDLTQKRRHRDDGSKKLHCWLQRWREGPPAKEPRDTALDAGKGEETDSPSGPRESTNS